MKIKDLKDLVSKYNDEDEILNYHSWDDDGMSCESIGEFKIKEGEVGRIKIEDNIQDETIDTYNSYKKSNPSYMEFLGIKKVLIIEDSY